VITALKGIIVWLVVLILVVMMCTTILPDYLPVDGTLDFLPTIIMMVVGFGGVLFVVTAMFKGGKGGMD